MFVGRESELAELERRWASGRFEFGVVYGTRRIGKTTMLQEFIKGKRAFYFQARKADEKDNLTAFSRDYRRFRDMDEHVRYEGFADAFESIAADAKSERIVFIIDEIAYLCQKNHLLAVECKYRKAPFSRAMLDHMRESLSLFDQYEVIDYYLVYRSGFTEDMRAMNDPHLHLVTLEDIFQPHAGKQKR